jgi:hypothetical protein
MRGVLPHNVRLVSRNTWTKAPKEWPKLWIGSLEYVIISFLLFLLSPLKTITNIAFQLLEEFMNEAHTSSSKSFVWDLET